MQFYTENDATHYQNGDVSDLEFNDDRGSGVPVSLVGFRGSASGIGPIITWKTRAQGSDVDFNFRWVDEFDVINRFEDDTFILGGSWKR